jgi:hypothetical protein
VLVVLVVLLAQLQQERMVKIQYFQQSLQMVEAAAVVQLIRSLTA